MMVGLENENIPMKKFSVISIDGKSSETIRQAALVAEEIVRSV